MGTVTNSNRVTDEAVLAVFRQLSDPSEALSTREVSDALGCSRRTAYNRLSALADSDTLRTKKVGDQVRIWWTIPDNDHPRTVTVDGEAIPDLTASQTLRLSFRSTEMAEPFIERNAHAVQIHVDEVVTLPDRTQLQYWSISGITLPSYLEIIENRPTVIDVDVLGSVDGTHRIEVQSTADSVFATFAAHDGRPTSGRVEDGALEITGEFPATVDQAAIVEAVTDAYPDLGFVSRRLLSTPELSRTLLRETLSDRQWTALQLSYYAGYFDRPRKNTGGDLADRMGITRQTFNRHLRDAQRQVARFIMEDLDGTGSGTVPDVE